MLLVRFSLYLTFAAVVREDTKLLAILTVFSVVIAIPWLGRGGVYETLYLNLLEASFVLNICLLTIVTYYKCDVNKCQHYNITSVFVGVAFAEFIGILAFHIFVRIMKFHCARHLRQKINRWRNKATEEENLHLADNDVVHIRRDDLEDDNKM